MNKNYTTTELLIQFIDGELEGEQRDAVKKSIEEDDSIREEFERLQLPKDAVKRYGLKIKIGHIHQEMMDELKEGNTSKTGIVRMMVKYTLRIAAIAILVTGSFSLYQYFTTSPEKLFDESFTAFPLHANRGVSTSTVEDAYKKEDMKKVIQLFDLLKDPTPEDYFLAGNAFLSTHQPAKAIAAFEALQQKNKINNEHFFEEDAEYYLSLGYLANNETEKAIPILEKINKDSSHPYHKKVTDWFLRKAKRVNSKK
jgi:tetratricopeptide (TPR) repeat protein